MWGVRKNQDGRTPSRRGPVGQYLLSVMKYRRTGWVDTRDGNN